MTPELEIKIRELIRAICVRAKHGDDRDLLVDEFAAIFSVVIDTEMEEMATNLKVAENDVTVEQHLREEVEAVLAKILEADPADVMRDLKRYRRLQATGAAPFMFRTPGSEPGPPSRWRRMLKAVTKR